MLYRIEKLSRLRKVTSRKRGSGDIRAHTPWLSTRFVSRSRRATSRGNTVRGSRTKIARHRARNLSFLVICQVTQRNSGSYLGQCKYASSCIRLGYCNRYSATQRTRLDLSRSGQLPYDPFNKNTKTENICTVGFFYVLSVSTLFYPQR